MNGWVLFAISLGCFAAAFVILLMMIVGSSKAQEKLQKENEHLRRRVATLESEIDFFESIDNDYNHFPERTDNA
jgi:cell division protein FtsB